MHNVNTHKGPSFSVRNRLARAVWNFFYLLFFRISPKPLHGWRRFLLRLFGAEVGKGVHVYPSTRIWAPWNLILQDGCGIAGRAILYSQDKITIGRKAVVSQGAHLCAGTHDYRRVGFPLVTKPIIVEDFVWVAAEAFIHPGVTLGEGSVIGARSVVVGNTPPWRICAGFPCKPLDWRMPEEEIQNFKNAHFD